MVDINELAELLWMPGWTHERAWTVDRGLLARRRQQLAGDPRLQGLGPIPYVVRAEVTSRLDLPTGATLQTRWRQAYRWSGATAEAWQPVGCGWCCLDGTTHGAGPIHLKQGAVVLLDAAGAVAWTPDDLPAEDDSEIHQLLDAVMPKFSPVDCQRFYQAVALAEDQG
jgi:hypothetical protein